MTPLSLSLFLSSSLSLYIYIYIIIDIYIYIYIYIHVEYIVWQKGPLWGLSRRPLQTSGGCTPSLLDFSAEWFPLLYTKCTYFEIPIILQCQERKTK